MILTKEQISEINNQKKQINKARRVVSEKLEQILYEAIPALDHGFVRVVDYMGDDTSSLE